MEKRDFLKLTVPNDLAYLPIIKTCVEETARRFGFQGDSLNEIELGVEEAVSSVIENSFEPGEIGEFDVICERIPMGMKIIIKDRGMPFDPGRIPDYVPPETLDEVSDDGMGIFLLKQSMDRYSFHNLGPEGKEMHLIKYLPGKFIEEYVSPGDLRSDEPPPGKPVAREKIAYDVRGLEPSEAIEVSRCAYKSHGYTFFDEHIYYPERLVELNRSGTMISAVAITKDNDFMGHSALVFPHPGSRTAELTFVFVNVEYRGQGCMKRLCEYLFTLPLENKLAGIYVYAVTNHVFTQKVMVRYGFHDCGMLLATSPATWVFKGISEENPQRISVALSFKYLEEPLPLMLYPPEHHRVMIEKIYENIRGIHSYAAPAGSEAALPDNPSVIETEIFSSENCAEIYVISYGADVVQAVKRILRDLCLKKVAFICLSLSLENPKTYFFTSEFEKMGFFFAGILPAAKSGDTLLLQYLNNVALDYDKVLAYTDMAKEILAYVKRNDPNEQ